jgi:hypothetical protein
LLTWWINNHEKRLPAWLLSWNEVRVQ